MRERVRITCTDYRPTLKGLSYQVDIMRGGRRYRVGHGFMCEGAVDRMVEFWREAGAIVVIYKWKKEQSRRASALNFVDVEEREKDGRKFSKPVEEVSGKGKLTQRRFA